MHFYILHLQQIPPLQVRMAQLEASAKVSSWAYLRAAITRNDVRGQYWETAARGLKHCDSSNRLRDWC